MLFAVFSFTAINIWTPGAPKSCDSTATNHREEEVRVEQRVAERTGVCTDVAAIS